MNWYGTAITVLVQLLIGAFVYGKLTGKVEAHEKRLDQHDNKFEKIDADEAKQWDSIGRQGQRIASLEGAARR